MDLINLAKQLESLGMIGLSLIIACGLGWVLLKREQDGMSQLKSAIDALTRAVDALNAHSAQTATFLQNQASKSEVLASDLKEVKDDLTLIKSALISVGVKSLTRE
jgi:hypothetical protein